MTIDDINLTASKIITVIKKQRDNNDFIGIIKSGIASLEYVIHLIPIMVNEEHKYRLAEKEFVLTPMPQGKAETLAKATEAYRNWRLAVALYDTLNELNMTCKKLSNTVDKQLNAQ